jgi:AcrR family transcriptional regulator
MVPVAAPPAEPEADVVPERCGPTPRRNRAQVLAAAEAVFADEGLKAQVDEIARRAGGVGSARYCRHFPTKQALVDAVLEAMYAPLLAEAEGRAHGAGCRRRSHCGAHQLADFQARHRALAESMATTIDLSESAGHEAGASDARSRRLTKNAQAARPSATTSARPT